MGAHPPASVVLYECVPMRVPPGVKRCTGPRPRQRKGVRMCELVVRSSVHLSLTVGRQVICLGTP